MKRLPSWIRIPLESGGAYAGVRRRLQTGQLSTVCEHAQCPNRHPCWHRGTATFMILGAQCTRACSFCAVEGGPAPAPPDPGEPERVAAAARDMGLRHVVITSVTRDDLPDGGAGFFAATIRAVRAALPAGDIEVLTPDFGGDTGHVDTVLAARPQVFNHNLETVARLQALVRPQAAYERSLAVLRHAAGSAPAVTVKSGLMLGLGEDDEELLTAMQDLRAAGCVALTLGQYLAPSRAHHPVQRFVPPEQFDALSAKARELGFLAVAAAPLVRSSYRAGELLAEVRSACAGEASAPEPPGRRCADGGHAGHQDRHGQTE